MRANINVSLPKKMKKEVDKMVDEGNYASRSELIREALRNWKKYKMWTDEELDQVGKSPNMKEKIDDTDYSQW